MQISITFYDEESGRRCTVSGRRTAARDVTIDAIEGNSQRTQAELATLPVATSLDALAARVQTVLESLSRARCAHF